MPSDNGNATSTDHSTLKPKTFPVVITRPPLGGGPRIEVLRSWGPGVFRDVARSVRSSRKERILPWRFRAGHPGVTSGLLRGLDIAALRYSYNPFVIPSERTVQRIGVLAGLTTLRWAVRRVEKGQIGALSVGPNVFILPSEARDELLSSAVKQILVPSPWVGELYASVLPAIGPKIRVWAVGVDTDKWRPLEPVEPVETRRCLIYRKNATEQEVFEVVDLCRRLGWDLAVIEYGRYSSKEYLTALRRADVLVFLGETESQGLAMFEAWSANVPTFVRRWRPHQTAVIADPHQLGDWVGVCASPYLSDQTGAFWSSLDELRDLLENSQTLNRHPRQWVLGNANLELAARTYYELVMSP